MIEDYHRESEIKVRGMVQFFSTARAVLKYVDSYLYRKAGLSLVKFIVLQALLLKERSLSLTDLAVYTNTERHNITTLIERLRKDGLVTTQRNRVDKRVINVELTDKGIELVKRAHPLLAKELVDQIMASITDENMSVLINQLEIMYDDTMRLMSSD